MNKPISTYEELLAEKGRLESLITIQKEIVRMDVHEVSNNLEPIRSLASLSGKLFSRDTNNFILNAGANTLINVVIKRFLLSRAGWLSRITIPFFLKNYSSHFISENKDAIIKKLFSWIGKKQANGQETADAKEE